MILNADTVLVASPHGAAHTPAAFTTASQPTGFIAVPNTDDFLVLLVLDLVGNAHMGPLSCGAVQPWWHLQNAGCPCLLAVPAIPLKAPPSSPRHAEKSKSLQGRSTGNDADGKEGMEFGSEGLGPERLTCTSTNTSSSVTTAVAAVEPAATSEDAFFVCLREGAPQRNITATTIASCTAARERWFQALLPDPSVACDLQALLQPFADAGHSTRTVETPTEMATPPTRVICRDRWPLPPVPPTTALAHDSLLNAMLSHPPFHGIDDTVSVQDAVCAAHHQCSAAPVLNTETVQHTRNLEESITVVAHSPQPAWVAVSSHVMHLSNWNRSLLAYLFSNADYIDDALLATDGTAAARTMDAAAACSKHVMSTTAEPLSPTRPSALRLLRVIFQFWQHLFTEPVTSILFTPMTDRNGNSAGTCETFNNSFAQWKAHSLPTAIASIAATATKTSKDGLEHTSPLLRTPTQISRAYFQDSLRKQQQLQKIAFETENNGLAGGKVSVLSPNIPSHKGSILTSAAALCASTATSVNGVSSPRSVALSTDYHLTPAVLVEHLLLSMDFSLTYHQSITKQKRLASPDQKDGDKDPGASRLSNPVVPGGPMSTLVPALSPSTPFVQVWGAYLVYRMLRGTTNVVIESGVEYAHSTFNENALRQQQEEEEEESAYDLGCNALDVWQEWVKVSGKGAASITQRPQQEDRKDGSIDKNHVTDTNIGDTAVNTNVEAPISVTQPSSSTQTNTSLKGTAEINEPTAVSQEQMMSEVSSAASPMSSPALFRPCWPSSTQLQRQSSVKRSTSHVSFSVSDVQRPYSAGVAPPVVVEEAAERAATPHRKEHALTSSKAPMNKMVTKSFPTVVATVSKHRRSLSLPATRLQDGPTIAKPAVTMTAAVAVASRLLRVIPNSRISLVKSKCALEAAATKKTDDNGSRTHSTTVATAAIHPSPPASVSLPQPATPCTTLATSMGITASALLAAQSDLPSVTHTTLPLRAASPVSRDAGVQETPQDATPTHMMGTETHLHAACLSQLAAPVTPQHDRQRPPSRIESWETSTSGRSESSGTTQAAVGETRVYEREKGGTGVKNALPGELPQAPPPPPGLYLTTAALPTNSELSSSPSMITSEHRLLPLIDDEADCPSKMQHNKSTGSSGGSDEMNQSHSAGILRPDLTSDSAAVSSSAVKHAFQAESYPCAADTKVFSGIQKGRGGLYSATSFTTVLAELLAQVVAFTPSNNPFLSQATITAAGAAAVVAAQRQLASIDRGQLFPSLATLNALNILPYYVHVWCYTYDPITQNNMKKRRLGAKGDGGTGSIGGGCSVGGLGGVSSGSNAVSGAYGQTYLQRYEVGSRGGDHSSSGGNGDNGGAMAAAAAFSHQILRCLIREGARTLWRGVQNAMARTGEAAAAAAATSVSVSGARSGENGLRSHFAQAFATNANATTSAATVTPVYGGGSCSGGRDVTKDPTLYNAVCGLYVTEQDIIIRSLPTAEVRKRRERVRAQQRQRRQEELRLQQKKRQQQVREAGSVDGQRTGGEKERCVNTMPVRRPRSTQNLDDEVVFPSHHHQQHRQVNARYEPAVTLNESDAMDRQMNHSNSDDEIGEFDSDAEAVDDVEETELLLLPRVGLLAVTACAVNRAAVGVFAEKYAHKLFLHQEDQVVALRAQQQQQKRQHRHGLRGAAPSVGLANLRNPSTLFASSYAPWQIGTCSVSNSADDVGGSSAGDLMQTRLTTATIQTHTTLRPFIEEVLQREYQTRTLSRSASSLDSGTAPHGQGGNAEERTPTMPSPSALVGAKSDSCRKGVQRYLSSLFRSTIVTATNSNTDKQGVEGLLTGGVIGSTNAQLLSKENITAAAVSAAASNASTHDGSTCSATAAAFAAAASAMSAKSATTSQPTLVLKIESKAMPTVWLEFADEVTLTYVYHLLETPLRSAAASSSAIDQTEKQRHAHSPMTSLESSSAPQPRLHRSLSTTATKTPSAAPTIPSALPFSPSSSETTARTAANPAFLRYLTLPRLPCYGSRFLSSARRHSAMVPLVMVAANVLPHGSAPSPFMRAFMQNVTVAMTVLELGAAVNATIRVHDEAKDYSGDEGVWPMGKEWRTSYLHEDGRKTSPLSAATVMAHNPTASLCLADTWWLYDPNREFHRQGLPPDKWTLANVNAHFTYCPTYPSRFVVPTAVAEAMELGELNGQHRVSRRVEAVSFFYAPTGGALVRSAQPAIARLFMDSATPALEVATRMTGGRRSRGDGDTCSTTNTAASTTKTAHGVEANCLQHRESGQAPTHPSSSQQHQQLPSPSSTVIPLMDVPFLILNAFAAAAGVSAQQLTVMDLRAVTAAYANMMRGGGTMDMLLYPFGTVEYAGLPNIHDMRKAWLRLRQSFLEVPYKLAGGGGSQRETLYVLRGGEPPYAAMVAAAERSAVTARPVPSSPSLQQRQRRPQQYQQHQLLHGATTDTHLSEGLSPGYVTLETVNAGSTGKERRSDEQAEFFQPHKGHTYNPESESQHDDDDEGTQWREQCLDVVRQAPIAARSCSDRQQARTATATANAAPPVNTVAKRRNGEAECSKGNSGNSAEHNLGNAGEVNGVFTGGEYTANGQKGTRASRASCSPFSFGGRSRSHSGRDASPLSLSSTAVSGPASCHNAAVATALEVTTQAQQEWIGLLAGLLNTAVVAARRVSGVPTDPLYVPAMEHNGAMANCFSYMVGHAFTRFWVPIESSANANVSPHVHEEVGGNDDQHGRKHSRKSGGSRQIPGWWSRRSSLTAAAYPYFDAAIASFGPSAHRTLAQVVFINCSDGWDRTAQVSVLTQLLLDPYYRTVEGLCVLLERELVCFGHPLQRRSAAVRGNVSGGWEVKMKKKGHSSNDEKAAAVADNTRSEGEKQNVDAVRSSTEDGSGPLTSYTFLPPNAAAAAAESHDATRPAQRTVAAALLSEIPGGLEKQTSPCTNAGKTVAGKNENDAEGSPGSEGNDVTSWFYGEEGGAVAAIEEGANAGGDEPSQNVSNSDQRRRQLWQQFWCRAVAAVSDGSTALKNKIERASSTAENDSSGNGTDRGSTMSAATSNTGLCDASPILEQLLDAIYQLVRLYPACFEFTEQFVMLLLDLLHCGLVSTFAVNSEQQVEEEGVAHGTLSLSQWCALLLHTTVTPVAAPATASTSTGETNSNSLSSTSVSPAHSRGPTQAPPSPPSVQTAGQSFAASINPKAAGAETSLTTTLSSIEASFQRLDSQFFVNSEDAPVEEETKEAKAEEDEGAKSERSTAVSTARPANVKREGMHNIPPFSPPPQPSSASIHRTATPTLPPSQSQQHEKQQQQLPLSARAVYTFDYTTSWQPNSADGVPQMQIKRRAAALSENGKTSLDNRDDFSRRLLPLSLDALYTSGYLNPEFSLRYNRLHVGPLVDFILPGQLVLWRAVYTRHSFWGTRTAQLQHGVGQISLYGSFHQSNQDESGEGNSSSSSLSQAPTHFFGNDGRRGLTEGGFSTGGGGPPSHFATSLRGQTNDEAAMRQTNNSGCDGGNVSRRGEWEEQSQGSLKAVPPSYAPLPGMMNFHIGSDSDEEETR